MIHFHGTKDNYEVTGNVVWKDIIGLAGYKQVVIYEKYQ